MKSLRKLCEHCGFDNHSRVIRCVCCYKVMEVRGCQKLPKSITPKFVKNFHLEVDKIRGFKK